MRLFVIIGTFFIMLQTVCSASDFIVEFVKENYREAKVPASYDPLIYHSIQVTSKAGPKLLILKGDDYHYRTWLRQYIARGKQLIAQIPDDRDDLFISSTAFEIILTDLHPVNLSKFGQEQEKDRNDDGLPASPGDILMAPGLTDPPEKTPGTAVKKRQDNLKQKQQKAAKENKAAQKRLSKEKMSRP